MPGAPRTDWRRNTGRLHHLDDDGEGVGAETSKAHRMTDQEDKAKAEALADALNAFKASLGKSKRPAGWQPTHEEQQRDMAKYDAAFATLLRKHGVDPNTGKLGGDVQRVAGSWYVQFDRGEWHAKFAPTGMLTVTPIALGKSIVETSGEALVDLTTAKPNPEAAFTIDVKHSDTSAGAGDEEELAENAAAQSLLALLRSDPHRLIQHDDIDLMFRGFGPMVEVDMDDASALEVALEIARALEIEEWTRPAGVTIARWAQMTADMLEHQIPDE
jgi:hypothetical protein